MSGGGAGPTPEQWAAYVTALVRLMRQHTTPRALAAHPQLLALLKEVERAARARSRKRLRNAAYNPDYGITYGVIGAGLGRAARALALAARAGLGGSTYSTHDALRGVRGVNSCLPRGLRERELMVRAFALGFQPSHRGRRP